MFVDETKYIERVAKAHGSKWCRPYQDAVLDLPEKSPPPKPLRYPFENVKESKRDESLDCGKNTEFLQIYKCFYFTKNITKPLKF